MRENFGGIPSQSKLNRDDRKILIVTQKLDSGIEDASLSWNRDYQ
jgi:hypothetical protein